MYIQFCRNIQSQPRFQVAVRKLGCFDTNKLNEMSKMFLIKSREGQNEEVSLQRTSKYFAWIIKQWEIMHILRMLSTEAFDSLYSES